MTTPTTDTEWRWVLQEGPDGYLYACVWGVASPRTTPFFNGSTRQENKERKEDTWIQYLDKETNKYLPILRTNKQT